MTLATEEKDNSTLDEGDGEQSHIAKVVQSAAENMLNIDIITPDGEVIELGMQSSAETPIVIKQYLLEVLDSCFYTSYALEWRGTTTIQLNDYIELKNYFSSDKNYFSSEGIKTMEKVSLHMVESPYDIRGVRVHMKRLLEVVIAPPTIRAASNTTSTEGAGTVAPNNDAMTSFPTEENTAALPSIAEILGQRFLIDKFYDNTLFQFSPDYENSTSVALSDNILSITISGWNPPPPSRKLHGDLAYFEVITAEEGSFHITAVSNGFYVNKSTKTLFDPNPISGT
jgi:Mitochondrial function, CLU-N-term